MSAEAPAMAPDDAATDPSHGAATSTAIDRWGHPARLLPSLSALGLYALGVAALARGLLTRLDTTIIGPVDGDNFWFAWSVWHFRQALLSGHDPSYSGEIRALTNPVFVSTEALFNQLLAVPLQSVLSPLGAYDVTILLSFVLSGIAMYLLASAFTRSWVACFVAGLVFTFSTYHFARADMHLGLLTLQMLPFCAWRLVLFQRDPSWRNAALAGVAAGLVPWADVYYAAYFLVTFGLALVVAVAIADRRWFLRHGNLARLVTVLAVAALVALPSIYPLLLAPSDLTTGVAAEAISSAKIKLSADPLGFFFPDPYNPLLGYLVGPLFDHQANFPTRSVFLGYSAIALAVVGFLFRRGRTPVALGWLTLALVGIVLALGPELHVAGRNVWHMPAYELLFGGRISSYDLLFGLPVLTNFRAPAVLAVVPLLAVSVLAALGAAAFIDSIARSRQERAVLGGALLALVVLGLAPSTVSDYRITSFQVTPPDLYRQIAASPDSGLLLDVPTNMASAQYFQTIHHKRLVGGILPREPARSLTAIDEIPYQWLLNSWWPVPDSDTAPVTYPPPDVFPLPRFTEGLREHSVSWVVLHQYLCVNPAVNGPYYCPAVPHYDSIRSFLVNALGSPFYDNPGENLSAWHVRDAPPTGPAELQFELGPGWGYGLDLPKQPGPQRLAYGAEARLFIDVQRAGAAHLNVLASSYAERPITLEARLNGRLLAAAPLAAAGIPAALDLGTVTLTRGRNVLDLRSADGCVTRVVDLLSACRSFAVQRVDAALR